MLCYEMDQRQEKTVLFAVKIEIKHYFLGLKVYC